jgi:ABC-2 type transport system permease protein
MIQTVLALIVKEFQQLRRDPLMIRIIILVPLVQMLVLSYALSTDVKYVYTAVYDFDRSELSREFVRTMSAGDYFLPASSPVPLLESERNLRSGEKNVNLIIPNDFSRRLLNSKPVTLGFVTDGANANSASIAMGYATLAAFQFSNRLAGSALPITLRPRILYNPEGESVYYIVPGIVAVLLTMITMFLTAMGIVRERENGTLEQLMVTPISTPALILGKIIPFAIVGYLEMSFALAVGILWFGIPFAGSWPLLYGLSFVFILTTLGVGMLVSTMTSTQQQAMFFTWFFSIYAILMSGFFIPIDNMPVALQKLTYLNPLRYYMTIVRGIMMKGAGLESLRTEAIALVVFAVTMFSFSWMRFSKRVK